MREITSPAIRRHAAVRVRAGELWHLGRHRLVCGSATDAAAVHRVLGPRHPLLMVTDPPYGVGYTPAWRVQAIDRGRKTARAVRPIANDHRHDWRRAWALFPGDVAYVWHSALRGSEVQRSLQAARFEVRGQIIWDKTRLVISRGHYHWRHEPCWYAVRKQRTASWQGDRKQTTVWPIPHRRSESGHAAEKPVDCMLRPILNHTRPGQAVYDPFVGSGTTIIAAEMSGRVCCAIELEPAHCAVAIARWQAITGKMARRAGD